MSRNPQTNCIIRSATPDDCPAIQSIYSLEVLEASASFETEPPDVVEIVRRQKAIVDAGLPYLVADSNSGVAGYAYAAPYRTRVAYRFTVENSVYVARWARNSGIGLKLLDKLVGICRDGHWQQMVAVIGDSANHGSIRLHEKAGFTHKGVLTDIGFKHGRWVDTVLMQLDLAKDLAKDLDRNLNRDLD